MASSTRLRPHQGFNGIDDGINGRSVLSLGLTPLNLLVFRLDLGYRF